MITDIEEIAVQQNGKWFSTEIKDKLSFLIKDLMLQDLQNTKDIFNSLTLLRKKYRVNPNKPQLNMIYDTLLKRGEIKENKELKKYFKGKSMRGLSGVIVISVITSPYPEYEKDGIKQKQGFSCKHDCFYCPKEVDENGTEINPRSYLSDEPTVARGLQNNFDAVAQYNERANTYYMNGHEVDKIEIIVLGGTWTEYPREYQETFIRDIFWAANTFYDDVKRDKLPLSEEQKINENTKSKIIGLTLEMRPDSINIEEIHWLRYLGCTRVQLGVQHIDKKILKKVNRGCYQEDAKKALKLLKDSCFKVDAHWMPDLPGSTLEKDKEMFDYIIDTDTLQFDQWKIYPTSVVPWTKIKKWHEEGSYIPYTDTDPENLINLLMYVKKKVPQWVRLNRVVRDIPNKTRDGFKYIYGGNQSTNLRQVLKNRLDKEGTFCRCIRCREVKNRVTMKDKAQIIVREYQSSDGTEYFISVESGTKEYSMYDDDTQKWYFDIDKKNEDNGIIYGFLRLRLSKDSGSEYFPQLYQSALIRELHVYGQVQTTNSKNKEKETQHIGFGKMMMKKAEEIAIQQGYKKIAVISGIGVRNYYRKLGYEVDTQNNFMIKNVEEFNCLFYINIINISLLFIVLLMEFMKHI